MTLDKYLDRTFDLHSHNCWHFACDVWFDLTGVRLHAGIEDWALSALHETASAHADSLTKLSEPVSPCLILMQRRMLTPHVGVYIDGKVLHLKGTGASYVMLHHATAGYPTLSYYR